MEFASLSKDPSHCRYPLVSSLTKWPKYVNFMLKITPFSLGTFHFETCFDAMLKVCGGSAGVVESFYGVIKPIPIV